MTLVQTPAKAMGSGGQARFSSQAIVVGVLGVAVISTVLVATSITARQSAAVSQADPLVGPAAIEFRAAEHAATVSQADPLVGPAAIEFRADERLPLVSLAQPDFQSSVIHNSYVQRADGAAAAGMSLAQPDFQSSVIHNSYVQRADGAAAAGMSLAQPDFQSSVIHNSYVQRADGAAAASMSESDPLLKPAAIEFRADEHAASGLSLQAIEKLRGESKATGAR